MTEKASLSTVISDHIDDALMDLHTMEPGIVVTYDKSKNRADVQPALKIAYADGTVRLKPIISNVPVQFQRAGKAVIYVPVKEGTYVTLHFAHKAIHKWAQEGGIVEPEDVRKHDLMDCVAVPGVNPFTEALEPFDADAICIEYQAAKIIVRPGGKISLIGSEIALGADALTEFVAIASKVDSRLASLEQFAATHVHATAGVGPPVPGTPLFIPPIGSTGSSKVKVDT